MPEGFDGISPGFPDQPQAHFIVTLRGPQVSNSRTFSSMITRGLTLAAQRITTQARPRIFFSTGLPPLALEKCLQSGLNHASPTLRPRVTSHGSTVQTDS